MTTTKSHEILERVYADHATDLLKWALRRFKSKEDAEDLCQEVMSRFAKMVITKEAQGEEIVKVDSYFWRIAYTLLDDYHRDSVKKQKLVADLEDKLHISQEKATDTDDSLRKLHISIGQLNYNLREAMIMFHLEKKSLSDISKKLNVTESYVKKILHESRQKIQQNAKNNLYEIEKVYRPNRVMMCMAGEKQDSLDFHIVSYSLSKQNICLACYERACSVEELTMQLGLPSAYVEYDINWLVDNGFLKKQKNRYSTMFFIFDGTFYTLLTNIYYQHKARCLDKIVHKLTALQDKIQVIGFIGSDKPIAELLWLMIYTFTDMAATQTYFEQQGHRFEFINKTTGEQYFPFGIFSIDSKIRPDPLFMKKYVELNKWEHEGTCSSLDDDNQLSWLMLRKGKEYLSTCLSITAQPPDIWSYKDLLYKVCKRGFSVDSLSDDERFKLSQCIEMGFLSLAKDDKTIVPNIYVFTPAQRKLFEDILSECFDDVRVEMRALYLELRKMCKAHLPKQLNGFIDFVSYLSLSLSNFFTMGFAYYDGKLYIPENTNDYTLLTLNVTVSDKPENRTHKRSVILKINYTK